MTHEELLAKIDAELATNYADEGGNFPIGLKALRAVVELHKPSLTVETNFCNVCWSISEKHNLRVMPVVYPCPTIQKIMDELK